MGRKVLWAPTRWVHCPCRDRTRMLALAPRGDVSPDPVRTRGSRSPPAMEMEFKDSSRRRTLVLIVGVLLALVAGAGVFYLSSQGGEDPITALPTREIVVAVADIPARQTISLEQLTTRVVPSDATNESAFTDPTQVAGGVAAVTILALQPITPNLLAGASSGAIAILSPTETISPTSPIWRAVS